MNKFIRSQGFLFGIAILIGVTIGVACKSGVVTNLLCRPLVSADSTAITPFLTQSQQPSPSEPGDGYTTLDKNSPIYVVETEEDNNIKCAAGHFQADRRVGNWEYYYNNGATKAQGEYQDNEKTGRWRYYYASGQLMSEGQYDHGQMIGVWVSYHANGKRKSEGKCDKNLKIGLWVEFPDEARPDCCWEGKFNSQGQLDGEWTYSEKGSVIKKVVYAKGKVVMPEPAKAPQSKPEKK